MRDYNFDEAIKECTEKYEQEFASCNILKATIASNGPHGGDSGHGGVTCFKLEDLGSTCWKVKVKEDEEGFCESLEIVLRGDTELQTFTDAISWAAAHAVVLSEGKSK